jgi:pyruvate/2-oxoacid:ferredoxin oxidoreductase alpha subunit
MTKQMKTMDGNTAAAYISYAFTDVACNLSYHSVLTDG